MSDDRLSDSINALTDRANRAEAAVKRVEALCDRREASDRRAREIEPEDWQANRDHYAARYGGPPELSIDVKRVRAALDGDTREDAR